MNDSTLGHLIDLAGGTFKRSLGVYQFFDSELKTLANLIEEEALKGKQVYVVYYYDDSQDCKIIDSVWTNAFDAKTRERELSKSWVSHTDEFRINTAKYIKKRGSIGK